MKKDKRLAVALKYDSNEKEAPYVIAKGKGIVAENIIEKAMKEEIAVIKDKMLADILIKLEIAEEIPEEFYAPVAEILSFIYNLDKEKGGL